MTKDLNNVHSDKYTKTENNRLNSIPREKDTLRDILVKDALQKNEKYNHKHKELSDKNKEILNLREVNSQKYQEIFKLLQYTNVELKDISEGIDYKKDKNGKESVIYETMANTMIHFKSEINLLDRCIMSMEDGMKQKEYLEDRKKEVDEDYREYVKKYFKLDTLKNKNDENSIREKLRVIHNQDIIKLSEEDKKDYEVISRKFEAVVKEHIESELEVKKDTRDNIRKQLKDIEDTIQEHQERLRNHEVNLKAYKDIIKIYDEYTEYESKINEKIKEKLVLENTMKEQKGRETNIAPSWGNSEFMMKFLKSSHEAYKKIKDIQKPPSWFKEVERDIYNAPLDPFELRDFLDKVRQTHFDRSEEMYRLEMSIQEKQDKLSDTWELKDHYTYNRLTTLFQQRTRLIRNYLDTNEPDSQTLSKLVTITDGIIGLYDTMILHSNVNEESRS